MSVQKPGRFVALMLLGCLAVALFALVYPVWVIRPFRHQGPRELMAALAVLRWRPPVVVLCVAVAVAVAAWYWRTQRRWWPRIAAVLGTLAVTGFALLTRVNIYELMFHPLDAPAFSAASASKLDGDEMILAVEEGREARAYPIRVISYHHIVNDTVGGVPIVATY